MRLFHFVNTTHEQTEHSDKTCPAVTIAEQEYGNGSLDINADCALYTWPSAVVLAQYIWQTSWTRSFNNLRSEQSTNPPVFWELGCGTGLPSILAALLGARVLLTDRRNIAPAVVATLERTCAANRITLQHLSDQETLTIAPNTHRPCVTFAELEWASFPPWLSRATTPPDVLLASDCLYDPVLFDDFLCSASAILESYPHAQLWCAYENRSDARDVVALCRKWNLQVIQTLDAVSLLEGTPNESFSLPNPIQIFIIAFQS
ncbi:hypothetical protein CAOG_08851 [Capsaspora owczarzaki ATCC 30864]|uniref:Uncharacterized protein n=1 Tax=Capsaspora owczarzaki (strain ATCC 30864) TaxID=595528 RepID=A0A0D2VT30_CAPO3|nr:hypothetical protein CAOG_08851 [Capsaspora owczarzaki ATCC 30864]KJE94367.1 hypothetical protein CAOG_008851 [Capsaspora owczarzaki ATCC 30864]|eukprot:XP_011270505.1 hypothetical protein CAOG_08851 [Capsaspora owczarzaki ATCC 30864]